MFDSHESRFKLPLEARVLCFSVDGIQGTGKLHLGCHAEFCTKYCLALLWRFVPLSSQENPPSRGTDSWCYSGMVPTGLDYHAPTLTKLPHCLPGQQRTLAIVRSACLVATFIALYTKSSLCWLYSKYFKLSSFWRKQSPRHNSNTVGFSLISLHPYSALSQILSSVPFQCVHTVFLIP